MRKGNRGLRELRPISIERGYLKHAEGSVLISMGDTRVICTASPINGVPQFLKDTGSGWITAEYAMLPRSTPNRMTRADQRSGRALEIQRLVGRALRAVTNLNALGERTIWIDCDVIQADGGTRTAAVNGAFVALVDALWVLRERGLIMEFPLRDSVGAVSIGIVDGETMLDLSYDEDSKAEVDMNIVLSGAGKIVEIQGTAEKTPFKKEALDEMLSIAMEGIKKILLIQESSLGERALIRIGRGR